MTAAVDRFVKYLVMECEDEESTAFADQLLVLAKAEILAGNGSVSFMNSASANGKSFTFDGRLTCDEIAFACRTAKRTYNDDAGTGAFTFLDLSST
jgi:hypothetical protein